MGRKIPGKKHRKIVDPEKQRAKRLESLKNKINNPPLDPHNQEVPRSVLEIMKLKNQAKEISSKKIMKEGKKQRNKLLSMKKFLDKDEMEKGSQKNEQFIPNLVQKPEESPEKFLSRVSRVAKNIIKESQFEKKFGVTIKKDMETGRVIKVEKDRRENIRKRNGGISKKKSLSQKRKEKKLEKTSKTQIRDFSCLKDNIEFGEVVHRPPVNLSTLKGRKIDTKKSEKYKNLLLQNLLTSKTQNKEADDKFKLEREEKEREYIINAYRQSKKMKKKVV